MIATSLAPPPPEGPIIELPDTPRPVRVFTNDEVENKLRTTILFLIDRIFLSLFYIEVSNIIRFSNELKEHEAEIKKIVNKWSRRCDEIATMCAEVIEKDTNVRIEETFHITNDLRIFDEEKETLLRRITLWKVKYLGHTYSLFPLMMKNSSSMLPLDDWKAELDHQVQVRMLGFSTDDGSTNFASTVEEISWAHIFFDSLTEEAKVLKKIANKIKKWEGKILCFDWPNEDTYSGWSCQHSAILERLQMAAKDEVSLMLNDDQN